MRVVLVALGFNACGSVSDPATEPDSDADTDTDTDTASDTDTGTDTATDTDTDTATDTDTGSDTSTDDPSGAWGDCHPVLVQTCFEFCFGKGRLCAETCEGSGGQIGGTITFGNADCEGKLEVLGCDEDHGYGAVRCCC